MIAIIFLLMVDTVRNINDIKIMTMIKVGHRYSKDVYVMMQESQHIVTPHYVHTYEKYESLRFKKL